MSAPEPSDGPPELLTQSQCALDIGGTLAKLIYFSDHEEGGQQENGSGSSSSSAEHDGPAAAAAAAAGGTGTNPDCMKTPDGRYLVAAHFMTQRVEDLIAFLKERNLVRPGDQLRVTGGGAFKFADKIAVELGATVSKKDEMQALMKGLDFAIAARDEVFRYDLATKRRETVQLEGPAFPFLVVNIGSGVSVLKANGPNDFVRVTGTCIGGGTVLGLARLLFGATSFEEVVELSEKGSDCLDLTVADLFGDSAGSRCLPGDTLASSFGRIYTLSNALPASELRKHVRREDLARSLVQMVSYNLGYIAYLVGTIHNVRRVFFTGKYINDRSLTMASITHGVNFYVSTYQTHAAQHAAIARHPQHASRELRENLGSGALPGLLQPPGTGGEPTPFEVLFVRHDGHLGALGAMLLS